jgi:hypothetical protein
MLYAFFRVIPRRLNLICQHFRRRGIIRKKAYNFLLHFLFCTRKCAIRSFVTDISHKNKNKTRRRFSGLHIYCHTEVPFLLIFPSFSSARGIKIGSPVSVLLWFVLSKKSMHRTYLEIITIQSTRQKSYSSVLSFEAPNIR